MSTLNEFILSLYQTTQILYINYDTQALVHITDYVSASLPLSWASVDVAETTYFMTLI